MHLYRFFTLIQECMHMYMYPGAYVHVCISMYRNIHRPYYAFEEAIE